MTISSDVNRAGPYDCNGSTTSFPFGFKVIDETHLRVVRTLSSGVETTLSLGTHYTVSGVGSSGGGSVDTVTAYSDGDITVLLDVPFTQEVDLENQGAYYAETIEAAFDLAAQRDLQLREEIDRSVKVPASYDSSDLEALISAILRLAEIADAIDLLSSAGIGIPVDPRMYGATNDGSTGSQASYWAAAVVAATSGSRPLGSAGTVLADQTIALGGVRVADITNVTFKEPVAGRSGVLVDMDFTGVSSAEPRASRVSVVGVNVGPNPSLGEYDFQGVKSQATGVRLTGDNGGNSDRGFWLERLSTGLELVGNSEKNIYRIHAVYNDTVVRLNTASGSPDTVKFIVSGTNNKRLCVLDDGDTSLTFELNTEGRIDDGSTEPCLWNGGATTRPVPYAHGKNGKHFKLTGRHRAHNGRVFFTDDRTYEDGSDTVDVDGLCLIHVYGVMLELYRTQRLRGVLQVTDAGNGRSNFAATDEIPGPVVRIRQLWDGSAFTLDAKKVYAREAVRFGDAANSLYPRRADLGRYVGHMGLGSEAYDPTADRFPTPLVYAVFEKAENCTARFSMDGNIVAMAGSVANAIVIENGADWIRRGYEITDETGATIPAGRLTARFDGRIALDDVAWLPWAFDGMFIEYVDEFDGPMYRAGGKWHVRDNVVVTTAQLQSVSHFWNTHAKIKGKQVFIDAPVWSSGAAATDAWKSASGSDVVASASVGFMAQTTAFEARVTSAGASLTTGLKLAYDRLYYDLNEAGVLSALILLYMFSTSSATISRLNLISGLTAGPYDLTVSGAPVFTSWRGWIGDGVSGYLATGYDPSVQAEGMGLADMHIGLVSLTAGTTANFDAGTRSNSRLRLSSGSGAVNSYSLSDSTSVAAPSSTGGPPHHLIASRQTSPVGGRLYRNGALVASDSLAPSGSLMPTTIDIFRQNTTYSNEEIAAFHVGKGMTSTQAAAVSRSVKKFMAQTLV